MGIKKKQGAKFDEERTKTSLKLSDVERKIVALQEKLIDFRGSLAAYIEDETVQAYATELAAHYFPKRNNPVYLEPVVHAFAVNLVTAPSLHSLPYLWRYNYDDLDLLAPFYKYTQRQTGYYHLAYGTLSLPKEGAVTRGCELLGLDLGEHARRLFVAYNLRGLRSRVAARVLETLAGADHDRDRNWYYGFALDPSRKELHKARGFGKFRYLRRGKQWMALGTAPNQGTMDLRQERVDDLFGYRIEVGRKDNKVRISVARGEMERAKAHIRELFEKPVSFYWRLKLVNDFYQEFHRVRRFANATNWVETDRWLLRRARKEMKAEPKTDWFVYQASRNRSGSVTYLPRRTNFFWNVRRELHCDYISIWNPYLWPKV